MSEILKIGIPTLLFQLLTSLSISMINDAAKEFGSSALAAMGPVTKIMSMGTLIVFGFLKGFQPIAGFSYGAKKIDRLQEAIKTSILWSTAFCVIFGLLASVFSKEIMSMFTEEDWGDDRHRLCCPACKWPFFHSLRLLHGLFFPLPRHGKSKGRLYSRSLQTGNLFCACHPHFTGVLGV